MSVCHASLLVHIHVQVTTMFIIIIWSPKVTSFINFIPMCPIYYRVTVDNLYYYYKSKNDAVIPHAGV